MTPKRAACALLLMVCLAASCARGAGTTAPVEPPALLPAGWQDLQARTVCLDVQQSIREAPATFSLPVDPLVRQVLKSLGLAAASAGQACDASLLVRIDGVPVAKDYVCILGRECGLCYTGAQLTGEVSLTAPGRDPVSLPLDESVGAPTSISDCPESPEQAPFDSLWPRAVLGALLGLWGPRALDAALANEAENVRYAAVGLSYKAGLPSLGMLMRALGDPSAAVRRSAAGGLQYLGEGAGEAVPALIDMLGDKDARTKAAAADALYAITGHAFGPDQAAWRNWLAQGRMTPTPWSSWDGIPMMPGSRYAGATGTMHHFTVEGPCDAARAYYAAAMPAAGWTSNEPANSPALSFRKGMAKVQFAIYEAAVDAAHPRCSVQFWLE